eukprot:PITA_23823
MASYNRARAGSFPEENYRASKFSCKRCCCCISTVFLIIAVIITAIALLILLVLKPKKPEFSLKSAKVESLMIEPRSNMPSSLTMNISMIFKASNPNKVGIKYSASKFYVFYNGVMPVGMVYVAAFYQPSHSNTTLTAQVVAKLNSLQSPAMDLLKDVTVNRHLTMRITGDVGAQLRFQRIKSPKILLAVDCQIVGSPGQHAIRSKTPGSTRVSEFLPKVNTDFL